MTEKFVTISKIFLFFAFIFDSMLAIESESISKVETHEIAAEIGKLKENDPYIKKFLATKDPNIRYFLTAAQKAKIVVPLNENNEIKFKFINDMSHLTQFRKGTINVNQEQAPKLHKMIKDFTDKAKIPMPFIFISFDKNLYEAFTFGYSKTLTCIVIGESFINNSTDNQLLMYLATSLITKSKQLIAPSPQPMPIIFLNAFLNCLAALVLLISFPSIFITLGAGELTATCIAATMCIISVLLFFVAQKIKFQPMVYGQLSQEEVDKSIIDLTDDPETFINAMQNLKAFNKKKLSKLYSEIKSVENEITQSNDMGFADILNLLIQPSTNTLASGLESFLTWIDKRIEFGKKEIAKKKEREAPQQKKQADGSESQVQPQI